MYRMTGKRVAAAPVLPPRFSRNLNPVPVNYGYDWDAVPNVILYIDNSNVFESAKKYSARKKHFIKGIPDVNCRIDIGKMVAKAVGNRNVLCGKLFGSEPPSLETVWNAIRKYVQVEVFHRSKWTHKEKQCDATLTAEAVEDIITKQERAGINRSLIIFSGDRDLNGLVDKALKYGFKVEIWAFKSSVNKTVVHAARDNPGQIQVFAIDDIFAEIYFANVEWGDQIIPRERSLLATLTVNPDEVGSKQLLKFFVDQAESVFRMPMMGKFIDHGKYILLVPCVKEYYTPPTSPSKPDVITVRTYDFYTDIQPFIFQVYENCNNFCSSVVTWHQFLNNQRKMATDDVASSTRFALLQDNDEDKEDEKKKNEAKEKESMARQSWGNKAWEEEAWFNSVMQAKEMQDEKKEEDYQSDKESGIHMSDTESEDSNNLDLFYKKPTEDDFIPCVRKVTKTKKNLYSQLCLHQYWCMNGMNCIYKHTEKEREYFKLNPNPKLRKFYKVKACAVVSCKFNEKRYLCPYAHDLAESRCLCCAGKGNGVHWMDQCPSNTMNATTTKKN